MKTKWIHRTKTVHHNTNIKTIKHKGVTNNYSHILRWLAQNDPASELSAQTLSYSGASSYVTVDDYVGPGGYTDGTTNSTRKWWGFSLANGNPYVNRVGYQAAAQSGGGGHSGSSLLDGILVSKVVGYLVKNNILPTGVAAVVATSMGAGASSDQFYIWYTNSLNGAQIFYTYIFPVNVEGTGAYGSYSNGAARLTVGSWNSSAFISRQGVISGGLGPNYSYPLDHAAISAIPLL